MINMTNGGIQCYLHFELKTSYLFARMQFLIQHTTKMIMSYMTLTYEKVLSAYKDYKAGNCTSEDVMNLRGIPHH